MCHTEGLWMCHHENPCHKTIILPPLRSARRCCCPFSFHSMRFSLLEFIGELGCLCSIWPGSTRQPPERRPANKYRSRTDRRSIGTSPRPGILSRRFAPLRLSRAERTHAFALLFRDSNCPVSTPVTRIDTTVYRLCEHQPRTKQACDASACDRVPVKNP